MTDTKPKGHVLIFNNKEFTYPKEKPLNTRLGTDEDEQSLLETFTRLDYQVEVAKDCTKEVGKYYICELILNAYPNT